MAFNRSTRLQAEAKDPLTPSERNLLNLLLEKQARAEAEAETVTEMKASSSVKKGEKPAEDPQPSQTKKLSRSLTQQKAHSSAKKGSSASTAPRKPETRKTVPKKSEPPKLESPEDSMSEGPLNDEELEQLIQEFGLEDPEDSQLSQDDSDDDDSIMAGHKAMDKMSDEQLVQLMNSYKKEKKIGDRTQFDVDNFASWVINKMQPNLVPVPDAAQSEVRTHKVVFQEEPVRRGRGRGGGRGGRGARGGRGGPGAGGGRGSTRQATGDGN